MQNKCQLITYPDSLGSNLKELNQILQTQLPDLFGGVHILPFYPSSGDRGFAPLNYENVDSQFGTWDDIKAISSKYDLIVDLMVNHISQRSKMFLDYVINGQDSKYADMFLSYKKFDPSGEIPSEQMSKIYTRKPRPPFYEILRDDGTREKVWCTFDYEQIDLDINSQVTKDFIERSVKHLAEMGVKMIRMDAFAYVTKELGTNCFFVEPETWKILGWLNQILKSSNVKLLPEIHEHYTIQQKIANHGYPVYDFCLPMLILNALWFNQSQYLKNWLQICPRDQITTLDTHDGIGVVDVKGLMSDDEISKTMEQLYTYGANLNKLYSGVEYNNIDIYQINCTYYSALGNNDNSYICARAIQFFAPGIPQVYYVGLFAGANDLELLERTKVGRNINRHYYTVEEVEKEKERPVVKRLFELMKFRNTHPAFNGAMLLKPTPESKLTIEWQNGEHYAELNVDLEDKIASIKYTDIDDMSEKVWVV